jgi:hypothetical protein
MFDVLDMNMKLELLKKLTENIQNSFKTVPPEVNKEELLEKLAGAWSDVDDSLVDEIYESRTISDRIINLD